MYVETLELRNRPSYENEHPNGAIVPVTTDPNFNVSAYCSIAGGTGSLNLILDVTGYFQ